MFAVVRLENPIWLSLVGGFDAISFEGFWVFGLKGVGGLANGGVGACIVIALILTVTNTLAFSRCDRFSQASSLASSAMYSGGMARSLAGGVFGRLFRG